MMALGFAINFKLKNYISMYFLKINFYFFTFFNVTKAFRMLLKTRFTNYQIKKLQEKPYICDILHQISNK